MRTPLPIKLYYNIDYTLPGEFSIRNEYGEFESVPEGWYYQFESYKFRDNIDLSRDFAHYLSQFAKNITREIAIDKERVKKRLQELNDKQLKKLCGETAYWMNESTLASIPNKQINKRIEFYETILYRFKDWYKKNNLNVPANCAHEIINVIDSNQSKLDVSKDVTKKKAHKMDYPKEAMIYLKTAMDAYPDEPKLRELYDESGEKISTTTWWHRRSDLTFISTVVNLINKKLTATKLENNRSEKLEEIKTMFVMRIQKIGKQKKSKQRKGDIYDRARKVNNVNFENIAKDTKKSNGHDDSDLKYNTLPILDHPTISKIILN